jgi:NADH dehydrogenase [ubiquinone] 1 alpha subcomplex assembly factor 7
MSPLEAKLVRAIQTRGPITVANYMEAALADPEYGYYRTGAPVGAGGDFITAPEISQMFGELIGVWLIDCWRQMGSPKPVRLVEAGPGRGVLMADALRVGRIDPEWMAAIDLHLIEIHPELQRRQAIMLGSYQPTWHEAVESVPNGPALFVANEFFDALPIRQFVAVRGHWHERLVAWTEAAGFHFVASAEPSPLALVAPDARSLPANSILELGLAAIDVTAGLSRRIAREGGAALIIDYGRVRPDGRDTLQAVRAHARADPLRDPGTADLTAHVDFAALARTAIECGVKAIGPISQAALLAALGIDIRFSALLKRASAVQAAELEKARDRLVSPEAMGELFKALAITADRINPPGFSG